MMTRNDTVVMQQFCVWMTFNDAIPVLSTKNDGRCHHCSFPDPQSNNIRGWFARLPQASVENKSIGHKREQRGSVYIGNITPNLDPFTTLPKTPRMKLRMNDTYKGVWHITVDQIYVQRALGPINYFTTNMPSG